MLDTRPRIGPAFVAAISLGFVASLGGTYWDAGWHTIRGRDEFLSPPHVLLYAGITILGAAFALRALARARRCGLGEALTPVPLRLGVLGAAITLAAGPIDDVWHRAFSRDAVIWSPPHMLGVIGTVALAAGVVLETDAADARLRRWFGPVAGAALLASSLVAVLEYDLDVPQFDETFYLPVLTTGAAFSFALLTQRAAVLFPATRAAAVYTAVMLGLGLVLSVWDYPAPAAPLLLPAAVAADVLMSRGRSALAAVAVPAAIFLVYLPGRALAGATLGMDAGDVVASALLALLGSLTAFALASGGTWPAARSAVVFGVVAMIALSVPPAALAHDPGQGPEAGRARLTARADGRRATLAADLRAIPRCSQIRPVELTARRAGQVTRSALERTGDCTAAGTVDLPDDGRWFLYAELERPGGRALETWLPLTVGGSATARDEGRVVYMPRTRATTTVKVAAGIVVYLALLGVLLAIGRTFAATRHPAAT